jgi:hypothetical protein
VESKPDRGTPWAALLRLWVVLAFSFVALKLLIELIYPGYIDLRSVTLLQFALIPAGQALVYWIVVRRARG